MICQGQLDSVVPLEPAAMPELCRYPTARIYAVLVAESSVTRYAKLTRRMCPSSAICQHFVPERPRIRPYDELQGVTNGARKNDL